MSDVVHDRLHGAEVVAVGEDHLAARVLHDALLGQLVVALIKRIVALDPVGDVDFADLDWLRFRILRGVRLAAVAGKQIFGFDVIVLAEATRWRFVKDRESFQR